MSDMVCCPLSGADDSDGVPECFQSVIRVGRKDYRCYECRETITKGTKGTKHEYASGLFDGGWFKRRTCLSCVEIRNHFSCGNGWIYGMLWSDMEDNFFPDMKAGGPCMEGLSPEAKARLFELRMKWYEERT